MLLRTSTFSSASAAGWVIWCGATGSETKFFSALEDQNAFVTSLDAAQLVSAITTCSSICCVSSCGAARRRQFRAAPGGGRWHEEQGDVVEAVRHYAYGDWAPAGRLLVDHYLAP